MGKYDKVSETEVTNYAPALPKGSHTVVLTKVEDRKTREVGDKYSVEYIVVESNTAEVGKTYGDVFFYQKNGLAGEYAQRRMKAFGAAAVSALGGDPKDTTLLEDGTTKKGNALVSKILEQLINVAQPGAGVMLKVDAVGKEGKDGKEYVNNTYSGTAQTKEQIKAQREKALSGGYSKAVASSLDSLGL